MKVALLLHPGFTALDVGGPFQVLAAAPAVESMLVADEPGSVADDTARCPSVATATFSAVPAPEVVVVPGSELSLELDAPVVVDWLTKGPTAPPCRRPQMPRGRAAPSCQQVDRHSPTRDQGGQTP